MFSLTKPTGDFIRRFIESQRHLPFNYAEVGASKHAAGTLPSGFEVDHNRICLGKGEAAFSAAVAALRHWKMFELGWVRLCWPDASIEAGTVVAVLANHFGFWSLHSARIVYLLDEYDSAVHRFGFAYGTLPAHGERGEERFSIEWHHDDDSVWYDLFAFSQPSAFLAKLGRPWVRRLQRRFAQSSLQAMARATATV